jgi:uncharacterized membrane protein
VAEFKPSYLIRGVPGHPLHPPLTDATIGAYTFATIAAVLSKLGIAEHGFAHGWWLALVVGIVTSVATIAAGVADWLTITPGTPLKRSANTHALTNAAASVFFVLAAIFGHGGYADASVTTGAFILTLLGFVLLTAGGTMGGGITYVHGMRVLSLPDEPSKRAMSPLPEDEKVEAAEG